MTRKIGASAWIAGEELLADDLNDTFDYVLDKYDFVTGENLVAGNPVYRNPADSKLYKAHGFKKIDSTSMNITPSTSQKTAKLSDTQLMVLTDNGTTTLTITVYDINSGASVASQTVTTSFDQTTDSTPTLPSATMCRLSDTTFIVFYARTTANNLYFRTGSISGATITMDTETAYSGTPDYCFGLEATPGASDGKVALVYFNGTGEAGAGGTWDMVLSYLTCSTNTATVTYTSSFQEASGGYNAGPKWATVAFTKGIAYGLFSTTNSGNINVIRYNFIDVIGGYNSSGNFTPNLESQTGTGVSPVYSQYLPYFVGHNGKAYFGYAITNGGTPYVNTKSVVEISSAGSRIFYQTTTVRLAGDNSTYVLPLFGNESGVIVTGFLEVNNQRTTSIYIQRDEIFNFLDNNSLAITTLPSVQGSYSNTKDEIVLCYIDGSSGFVKQWRMATLFDGFVDSNVTAPAVATLFEKYIVTSGLTANASYFLKDEYTTIGDMDYVGTIPVGDALSTTVMKINT